MRLIFDARPLDLYPGWASGGFFGGTEGMVQQLAHGLAEKGHTVHVITPDLPIEQQRGPTEWWWPANVYPHAADALVLVHSMERLPTSGITAPLVIMATNGIDPPILPDDQTRSIVDAWPVFSETHKRLLCATRPAVDPDKCFLTGLGVELPVLIDATVPGRMLYANDPQRGLWHVLDIFDELRKVVPDASLHIAYEFDRQFEPHRWQASAMAEVMWECKRRIETTPGIVKLGHLSREELIREQLECSVHVMPSDPPNVGSQIHGITQMECAAAGAALVLSDTEAFPEIFGEAATILPLPGAYLPDSERRVDALDWAEHVAELMGDDAAWQVASALARGLAEKHTWAHVIDRWDAMLETLAGAPEGEAELALSSH